MPTRAIQSISEGVLYELADCTHMLCEIALAIESVQGEDVSIYQVLRFSKWPIDLLPIYQHRRPGASHAGHASADRALVEAWANRHRWRRATSFLDRVV